MQKTSKIQIALLSVLLLLSVGFSAHAGSTGTCPASAPICIPNPLICPDLFCVLGTIASVLYWIAWPVVTIMILWGAFQFLTAGGKEEQIKSGKRTLTWAVVGFVILLIAGGISSILRDIFS